MIATEYVIQNWALILVLLGFTVSLISTVFLERKVIDELLSESDANMYAEKQLYYKENNKISRDK